MPAVSQRQKRAAAMALSAKRKDIEPSSLQGSAKQMYESMDITQLSDFASTPLPKTQKSIKERNKNETD